MESRRTFTGRRFAFALFALAVGVQAATTDLAQEPISGASSIQIFPNILFVLDDSGSMNDDALPDWAKGAPLHQDRNAAFNGLAYNPNVLYSPPSYFTGHGAADTVTYPSQTRAQTNNWTTVADDGYGKQSTNQRDLSRAAFYYTTVAGEYCIDKTLRICKAASAPSQEYPYPANLRWCDSLEQSLAATPADGACRATQTDSKYKYPRMPEPHRSILTVLADASLASIRINGQEILSNPIVASAPLALASAIEEKVNACRTTLVGACTVVGYSATAVGNTVKIYAPSAFATDTTPVLSPSSSITASKFGRSTTPGENQAPGDVRLTVIHDAVGTIFDGRLANKRTDCVQGSCTYEQEMTNYANWWAYYHTRMQSMKTASSASFAKIDSTRRVGYSSINNNTGSDFLNVSEFTAQQKKEWYDKLFAAVPKASANTPLRLALANAGYLYAGKFNNQEFNGVTVKDPVQYYCQKNTTILSTDGYWNEAPGFKLDSTSTPVGDQDGPTILPKVQRPQLDGGAQQASRIVSLILQTRTPTLKTVEKRTEQLQQSIVPITVSRQIPQSSTRQLMTSTTPLLEERSYLEQQVMHLQISTRTQPVVSRLIPMSRTAQLQKRTFIGWEGKIAKLLSRTSPLQSQTNSLFVYTAKLQTQTYVLQIQETPLLKTSKQVQQRTSSDGGLRWSEWSDVDYCEKVVSGTRRTQCQTLGAKTVEARSCTAQTGYTDLPVNVGKDNQTTASRTDVSCAYGTAAPPRNATTACTKQARSSGGEEGSTWLGPATDCSYLRVGNPVDATESCTPIAQSTGPNYTVLTARECKYTPWSSAPAKEACVPQSMSTSPPYTVLTARRCQYGNSWPNWANSSGTCTPANTDLSNTDSPQAVRCRYAGFGQWLPSATACQEIPEDTKNYSRPMARECAYGEYSDWVPLSGPCSVATAEELASYQKTTVASECRKKWSEWVNTSVPCDNAGDQTECRYSDWTAPVPDATCAAGSGSVSALSATQKKECFLGWSEEEPITTCIASDTVRCGLGWSSFIDADSCTPDANTRCQYNPQSEWSKAEKCTASADNGDFSQEKIVNCRYSDWVVTANNASSCNNTPRSGASPFLTGTAIRCSYPGPASSPQAAYGGCTEQGQTGNKFLGPQTRCWYAAPSPVADDPQCPNAATTPSDGPNYTVDQAVTCSFRWSAPMATDYCAADATTKCEYGQATDWSPVAECVKQETEGSKPLVNCQNKLLSDWQTVTSLCKESQENGLITRCREGPPLPPTQHYVGNCDFVDQVADETNGYVSTHCATTLRESNEVDDCTPQEPLAAICPLNNPDNCARTTCQWKAATPTPDTLADVAQYYYMTDLRSEALHNCYPNGDTSKPSVCGGTDPTNTEDQMQRMETYTLGLGASGLMQYDQEYPKAQKDDGSDFASIQWETIANPNAGICSWQRGGICNWPEPAANAQANIDDLWHAAVNGRGRYFSAGDPSTLSLAISSALADIGTATGSRAAVTVTSPNFTEGDNGIFEVSFEVGVWAGDVIRRTVDSATLTVSPGIVWSAEDRLRKKMNPNGSPATDDRLRTIYTYDTSSGGSSSTTNKLKPFTWDALSASERNFLSQPHISDLSQFCTTGVTCLGESAKADAAGENLLKFLRGNPSHEGPIDDTTKAYYRLRMTAGKDVHRPLGDIAGSEAVYVQGPQRNYVDKQYTEFKKAYENRKAMVYVGANDGMLHAFDAQSGDEEWAYIPSQLLPRLYKLADKNYPGKHQFYVDGTPVVGDICADSAAACRDASSKEVWKTILVGGLNAGGRAYYALDVTDPTQPKALWEFTHDNLGYTYGNPVITKLKDGSWVVMVASGYNNVGPGDGEGHLFILDAGTGQLISSINNGSISTGVGDTTTPSGLAKISAWADFPDANNTAQRVYGGDLLGNLWRFDINGEIGKSQVYDAQRLASFKDPLGKPQVITAKPELGKIKNSPVVMVGTGKLLGVSDFVPQNLAAPKFQQQSFYAVKDRLTDTDYGNPRTFEVTKDEVATKSFTTWRVGTGTCPAGKSFCTEGQSTRSLALPPGEPGETPEEYAERVKKTRQAAIDDAFGPYNDGWYLDFPSDGEQANTDPTLIRGTIVFNTNTPQEGGGCKPLATSYRYFLDYRIGFAVEGTDGIIGTKLADILATKAVVVLTPSSEDAFSLTRTDQPATRQDRVPLDPLGIQARRISWRELVNE